MNKTLLWGWFAFLVVSLPLPRVAPAQVVDGKQVVKAELVKGELASDGSMPVAIRFSIEPGWYLYWKNPGDAGLPITVKWNLPPGYSVGELLYPTPTKMVENEIVAYGYKHELAVVTTIRVPSSRLQGTIKVALDWLVCKESCLRGTSVVEIATNTPPNGTALISHFTQQLPRPLATAGLVVKSARVTSLAKRREVVIEFSGENALRITDFYPEPIEDVAIEFLSIQASNGRVRMILDPYKQDSTIKELRGLVIVDGVAYECAIPVRAL